MDKVIWGILGTANIAKWATIPGMRFASSCDMFGIAGRNPDKANQFKEEYKFARAYGSYEQMVADPDIQAVYIPLPNDLHKKWVIECLKAGKHVLCEKPLALNADEACEMYAAASQYGVHLMEAYAYLHSPYVDSLKKDISDGLIGDVDYIESAFITQGYKEDFRLHKAYGGGAMYDLGCYCTTMILSLVDSDPELVKAVAEFTDLGVDVNTSAVIRFKNGVRASFNVGMIFGENSNSRFDRLYIHGSKGCIKSDVEYNMAGDVSYKIYNENGVTERKLFVPQNYGLEIENMSRCILYNEKLRITPEFSIKNAELIDKVLKEIGY